MHNMEKNFHRNATVEEVREAFLALVNFNFTKIPSWYYAIKQLDGMNPHSLTVALGIPSRKSIFDILVAKKGKMGSYFCLLRLMFILMFYYF